MSEPGIGRVLVASLHQAIGDVLPQRLVFYENYLTAEGLRGGTIGLAPLLAVLSFLRQEGAVYEPLMARAGVYAAEWTVQALSGVERTMIESSPRWVRARMLLRLAGRLVSDTYPDSRASGRLRRGQAQITVRNSIFCTVREPVADPLCHFYAAAYEKVLALFDMPSTVQVASCRATDRTQPACVLSLVVGSAAEADVEAPAA